MKSKNCFLLATFLKFIFAFLFIIFIPKTFYAQENETEVHPEFIRNWIIPSNFIFGSTSGNPGQGLKLAIVMRTNNELTGIKVDRSYENMKNVPLPPWFIEKGFSWDDSFALWKQKLEESEDFIIQLSNEPTYISNFKNGKETISFHANLYVIWKKDPAYYFRVLFSDIEHPYLISVNWNKKGWGPANFNTIESTKRRANEWNKLSEDKRYICAFSSNLIELNNQYFEYLNPAPFSKNNDSKSQSILKNSWSCTSKEEVFAQVADLEAGGHAGSYRRLLAIENKHPNYSVFEISKRECLSIIETSRLFFIRSMKDKLGSQGLEAWDKGREITILRWAIASGYLSEEEALEKMLPISNYLKSSYVSWEDFTAHYIAGRAFYGLYDGDYRQLTDKALNAAVRVRQQNPVETLTSFTFQNKQKPMKLSDAWYEPTEEALAWDKIVKIYYTSKITQTNQNAINEALKLHPELPCLHFLSTVITSQLDSYSIALQQYKQASKYFDASLVKSETYDDFYFSYAITANQCGKPEEALEAIEKLSTEKKKEARIFYEKGLAYAKLIGTSPDYEKNIFYAATAWENFTLAQDLGLTLPESLATWLNNISGISIEE